MASLPCRRAIRGARSSYAAMFLALLLLVGNPLTGPSLAAADEPGEIVVQPAPGKTIADVNRRFKTSTALELVGTTQALVQSGAVKPTLAAMRADAASPRPTVAWAEENVRADDPRADDDSGADTYCPPPPRTIPTEATAQDDSGADQRCTQVVRGHGRSFYQRQYAVHLTDLDQAQALERGEGQVVAVLDTRVDGLHPELALRVRLQLDLLDASRLTRGPTKGTARGHGTFVAGVVHRAAPAARILPVAVLNDDGRGSTAQVAAGIRWAVQNGATVINMSLHSPTDTRVMREAVAHAIGKGVVVVAAYGNEGKSLPAAYPADYPGVIPVMATDHQDVRATFSNYGRPDIIAAPGVNIVSLYPNGRYAVGSGTSYAAPWVAGQAALLRDARPALSPADVARIVSTTADDVTALNGGNKTVRVDMLRAVVSVAR
jgi:subtilisin family serine protease